ncbi:MAG: hypothetical protein K9I68_08610 [Bacteroidales bacterium]|nr:hypothetical protein [Bacteroidales bacterium]MCF8336820.1 hypothetical protein [Bacteroidales bacterium]
MRILNADDIHRLAENVNFADVIERAADKAEENNFMMPERQQLAHGENTHLFMPVFDMAIKNDIGNEIDF